jgi:lipopolysaccharide export system permease protein
VKIISRYVLREHVGPLTFSLTALTSLMLLNFISRQFGELVGKGLPWKVIGEFFMLSIPFTIALTVPMSVLVAVLYAFSRLASENEVTAMKANGVSPWRMVAPALVGGVFMSLGLLAFNDQVLPRANHRLKVLQENISQTKPTLLLKEQVVNSIAEGKLYLKAGNIDNATGKMREVVIYDLADPMRRRTIYADRGRIAWDSLNLVDLWLELNHGEMQEVSTEKPGQMNRLFYEQDRIRVRNVGGEYKTSQNTTNLKGDREMSICEMQRALWQATGYYEAAKKEHEQALKPTNPGQADHSVIPQRTAEPHGLGWLYCSALKTVMSVREAQAADLSGATLTAVQAQDTVKPKPDTAKARQDSIKAAQDSQAKAALPVTPTPGQPAPGQPPIPAPMANAQGQADSIARARAQEAIAAQAAAELMRQANPPAASPVQRVSADTTVNFMGARTAETKIRLELAQRQYNRYQIEIHKKFSLAAACLIFCILAPPIALRFPRGGVGLVIGVSLAVFALYYVGLIGGESLANKGLVPPFWAMWGTNVILTVIGIIMLLRMGRDSGSGRGGGIREWLDERRLLRDERRAAALAPRTA